MTFINQTTPHMSQNKKIAHVRFDELHGHSIKIEWDGPLYLLTDGTTCSYLPYAQPWLCWFDSVEAAAEQARACGYEVGSGLESVIGQYKAHRGLDAQQT